jgi:hypothetical protein
MISLDDVARAKTSKLNRLISALEDQDKLLEGLTDKMPKCDEKKDLLEVMSMIIELLGKIDGMLSV